MGKEQLLSNETTMRVIKRINQREWWRTWINKQALKERGLFLESCFRSAEFYGRPLDNPFKVNLKNPLIGDDEFVMSTLGLPPIVWASYKDGMEEISEKENKIIKMQSVKMRIAMDMGFDSIAILSANDFKRLKEKGRLPNGYDLQVFFTSDWHQLMQHPDGYGVK